MSLRRLKVGYGAADVLHGVDLEIEAGEIVCLLGSNGAGKTTTIRAISGQLPPRAGTIWFAGEDISSLPATTVVGKGIVTVPEGRRVFAQMSVRENLLLGAFPNRQGPPSSVSLDHAFDMFPRLKEREHQAGGTLSGGEQQMLAMARALMSDPTLLLLDEPSMGLAPILIDQVFDAIERLSKEGITVLLVEQNAEAALDLASRGSILERGEVRVSGAAGALRSNPDVQRSYLGVA